MLNDQDLQRFIAELGIEAVLVYPDRPTPTVPAAAEALGVRPQEIVKSLVFLVRGEPWLVIAAGEARVSFRRLREELGVSRRKLRLASAEEALEITGFAVGAMPPFGHLAPLRTIIDSLSVPSQDSKLLYGGGGTQAAMLRLSVATLRTVTQGRWLPLTAGEEEE
ncbi:MAG: YbaK/EbsC family protein [Truepera sp.]|nr:YbaK/EbsC family protein [Truepera sp.]